MEISSQTRSVEVLDSDGVVLELGDVADLTLGGESGGREDKRREVA